MATKKKKVTRKTKTKKTTRRAKPAPKFPPKARSAVKKAADAIWEANVAPHTLLKELHEVLLLRCLKAADGNYAAAAEHFGPSRQSVQQYANSPLRDDRWKPYQQSGR